MLETMLNALFGCTHQRITFPITPGRNLRSHPTTAHRRGTYVACLDCGQEFRYDWNEMRIGEPVQTRPYRAAAESLSPANQ
jgi:RNase P subunit RPR2